MRFVMCFVSVVPRFVIKGSLYLVRTFIFEGEPKLHRRAAARPVKAIVGALGEFLRQVLLTP